MKRIRSFFKSETGTLSVETAIVFPLLLWAFVATFVFWDIFYARSINMRAAYTIADALSRETDEINEEYMDGMQDMLTFLLKGQHDVRLRVTTVVYDHTWDEFEVEWSYASDHNWEAHDTDSLVASWDKIPPLARGDTAIIVESELAYVPFFNVGLWPMTMDEFIVTRPRFGPQLVWERTDGGNIIADGEADEDEDDVIVEPLEEPV